MEKDIKDQILKLKKEKNAIILAHYYQIPEIQDIADAVGDSYYLSEIARDCKESIIVFCGVKFMAESAKILSPEKTVLFPVLDAGCPMADMANTADLIKLKSQHPKALTVCYINSSTEVKALCDVCVTSSSALKIINKVDNQEIIFLPDRNLGGYIAEQFPDKKFILWEGFCPTHEKIEKESILKLKNSLEDVKILVHPECNKEIRDIADYIGSTSGIIKHATESTNKNYIIVTEEGVLYELKKNNPNKNFHVIDSGMICSNMKKTTLEDVYNSLLNMQNEIILDQDTRIKAHRALMNMHEMAR
ncbi:quinolinate synthase NadA [Haloimpatiens massiliensis]|uniref:quinolinate synthase NadA n=1 Tax=Haloimpatiens massiliensis TaxID=1658110 RepID=UPI000C822600|nr:quinolinate synthase NadA [Haloimpatiens massiliensis]